MLVDQTLALLQDPYLHLGRLAQRHGSTTYPFRLLGRRATRLIGQEATRFFYDESCFDRHGVIPAPVRDTLFGAGAVHLLDGVPHAHRKAAFLDVLDRAGTEALVEAVDTAWAQHFPHWPGQQVEVFEESAQVLARGVHAWAGVPLPEHEVAATAADLVAMVDGFGSVGPRHVRARRARSRQEARGARLVAEVRAGSTPVPDGSPVQRYVDHRDTDGEALDEHTAAVEIINLLRPTTAVAWFVAFAAHAMHVHPEHAQDLTDQGRATAFTDEVRRFYPFAPFLAARAKRDVSFHGVTIPESTLAVLDIFGQDHDRALWPEPWRFDPARHRHRAPGLYDLIPQGGGEPTGHRCPGEPATVGLLSRLVRRLAALDYRVPPGQDLRVTRHRAPARVAGGVRIVLR